LRAAASSHGAISLEAAARQLVTVALAILPVLISFLLAQRSFIAGLTRTGLKG
jgi:ABC-type glycerol-3-phosphate transport system permease component